MLATLPCVQRAGFETLVACPATGPLREALVALGIDSCDWRVRDENARRYPLPELRTNLSELITRHRPDLLHANSLSMARVAGPVAKSLDLLSVGHLRDIVKLSRQAISDLTCNSRLIAVSTAVARFHLAQGVPQHLCKVIYNGVDLQHFAPRPPTGYLHQELGLSPGARLAATIGQLGLRKGTDIAQSAMRFVAQDYPNVHWLVVGSRTSEKAESRRFEKQLRAAADQPPLRGRVHFLGTRDDVSRLLNEIDVLLHAAHQEPLGRVLLEAAASGIPVVATDVGGTREIFPTAASGGLLSPPNDATALAAYIAEILDQDDLSQTLGRAARRRAEDVFDVRQSANALVACYNAVRGP